MNRADVHLSDPQLLLEIDGELSVSEEKAVRAHLEACWKCRARRQEIETSIADFGRAHQRDSQATSEPAPAARAMLRARLAQVAAMPPDGSSASMIFAR